MMYVVHLFTGISYLSRTVQSWNLHTMQGAALIRSREHSIKHKMVQPSLNTEAYPALGPTDLLCPCTALFGDRTDVPCISLRSEFSITGADLI